MCSSDLHHPGDLFTEIRAAGGVPDVETNHQLCLLLRQILPIDIDNERLEMLASAPASLFDGLHKQGDVCALIKSLRMCASATRMVRALIDRALIESDDFIHGDIADAIRRAGSKYIGGLRLQRDVFGRWISEMEDEGGHEGSAYYNFLVRLNRELSSTLERVRTDADAAHFPEDDEVD